MLSFFSAATILFGSSQAGWTQTGNTLFPIMDIGINNPNATFSTELASTGSWVVESSNLGETWDTLEQSNDGLMDIACSALDNMTAVVSSVMGRVVYTHDGGSTWSTSIDPLFGSQSIQRSRDGSGLFCGAGGNKISISSNKGVSWKHHDVGQLNNGSRYCALPTKDVWYVTAGMWGGDEEDENLIHLTSRLMIDQQKKQFVWNYDHKSSTKRRMQSTTGMWAELWKTADAGNTWTRQISSDDSYYFNGVDCCDATHCIAVAEGDAEAGSLTPGTRIFMTSDGNTWSQVFYDPDDASSLMTAHCVSDTEMYAGGGDIEGGRGFDGFFLHTMDGGQTWTNTTVGAPIMWMDMSDDGKYGVASGISKTSGGVEFGYQ